MCYTYEQALSAYRNSRDPTIRRWLLFNFLCKFPQGRLPRVIRPQSTAQDSNNCRMGCLENKIGMGNSNLKSKNTTTPDLNLKYLHHMTPS